MKFSVMIPQNYNDGRPVGRVHSEGIYRLFWSKFGGCTVDPVSDGYWFDEEEQKLYVDKMRRLTVVVDVNSQANLDYARLIVRKVGVLLGQKCMYFEHDSDLIRPSVVEIIDIDPEEDFNTIDGK